MSHFNISEGYTHTIYLKQEQYLPQHDFKKDSPWSIALNVLASFRLTDYMDGNVALFFEYQDLRGKHRLPVDFLELEFESALLFSNLIQIPVRGEMEDVCLKLVGIPSGVEVETELLHLQIEQSRCFINNQPMVKNHIVA